MTVGFWDTHRPTRTSSSQAVKPLMLEQLQCCRALGWTLSDAGRDQATQGALRYPHERGWWDALHTQVQRDVVTPHTSGGGRWVHQVGQGMLAGRMQQ